MLARRLAILLLIVLLPALLLAPAWSLAGLGAGEDDVLYYYPARVFFHDTVQAGHWPWFNPATGLGRPYAADPQSALWYPPTWIFAALPPLWAYPLSLWAHYSLALWGTYRLLRALRLGRTAALFGGLVFAFSGFMLAHRAHFAMQNAAAWTPWVFWRLHRYALSPPGKPAIPRLTSAVVLIALQCFAGHVQIAALTALGTLVLLLFQRAPTTRNDEPHVGRRHMLLRWLVAWVCAAGLFAVQWLPTLDYTRLCTRVERSYLDFVENSWYPVSAIGAVLPMFFGQRTPNIFDQPYWGPSHQVEQFGYAGILPLLLALLALRAGWRADRRRRPWVLLAIFALLLALGIFGPICPILYYIPGSSVFRCPARALLLVNLAIAVLAAITLNDLVAALSPQRARLRAAVIRWTRRPPALALLLIGVPLVLAAATWPLLPHDARTNLLRAIRPWNSAVWIPLLIMFVSLTTLGAVARRWQRPKLIWLLVALTALDLGVIGWSIDVPADCSHPRQLVAPRRPANWMLPVQQSTQRLWVVNARHNGTPGEYIDSVDKAVANTNILRGIASLSDYGPLQPRAYVQRFGFHPWGESWMTEQLLADTDWMRTCNVGWILLCDVHRPAPAGCELATTTPAGWRLYRNPTASGWACFENAAQPGAIRFERHSPSEFTVWVDTWPGVPSQPSASPPSPHQASTPRVVISQLHLPGWSARIDGRPVPIEPVDDLLAGVRVPPGQSIRLDCSYFPPGLTAGALISALSAAVLIGATIWSRRTRERAPSRT